MLSREEYAFGELNTACIGSTLDYLKPIRVRPLIIIAGQAPHTDCAQGTEVVVDFKKSI